MHDRISDHSLITWKVVKHEGRVGYRRTTLQADACDTLSIVVLQRACAYVEMRTLDDPPASISISCAILASAYAAVLGWSTGRAATPPRVEVHLGTSLLVLRGPDVLAALRVVYGDRVAARLA